VHCHNIAGVASTLVKYQKRLGIEASLIVRRRHSFGFTETPSRRLGGLLTLARADVIHYHSNSWIGRLPLVGIRNPDARLFSQTGKPLVAHFHGDDLRLKLVTLNFKPDHVFVSTPDLLEYSSGSEWLPNPVDCEIFRSTERERDSTSRIGYYSPPPGTDAYVPTAEEIGRAISKLRDSGFHVEAAPAANIPYDHMPEYYQSLTVWVDKLKGGFYSLMACEAACSGLPVIASTAKVKQHVGGEVFYEFTGNLAEDLQYILQDDAERLKIANRGREYVEAKHEASKVARRTIEIYQSIT
jgi:glycosyltransferase involved in cell wall biosynthesis